MRVLIEVQEGEKIVASAECDAVADESVEAVVTRLSGDLGLDAEELLVDLVAGDQRLDRSDKAGNVGHGNPWSHRRTCVDLHFESLDATHRFPARARWERVHKWGCHRFGVPKDLCVNLELREGSPTGPALNEEVDIGLSDHCKHVWLVKPGPEPNGCRD